MPQQQLQQVEKQREELVEESKEQQNFAGAAIRQIDDQGVIVNVTNEVLRAEAKLVQNGDTEEKIMDFSEEEQTTQHVIPFEDAVYEQFKASPWAQVQDILAVTEAADLDASHLSAWELVQQLRLNAGVVEQVATDIIPVVSEPETADDRPAPTVTAPLTETRVFAANTDTTAFRLSTQEAYRREEHATYTVDQPYETMESSPQFDTTEPSAAPQQYSEPAIDETHILSVDEDIIYDEDTDRNTDLVELILSDGSPEYVDEREHVTFAAYDVEETEGVSAKLAYQASSELVADGATVKDTLLELVDRGELDATIVKQPFYSDETFTTEAGEAIDAGWQDGFYGVVQMEGMDVDMTEFSYGDDLDDLDLAMNDISQTTVDEGDYVDFKTSEEYTCGVAEDDSAHREAWQDRYGVDVDRFDSVTERGVYAAMMDGNRFEGSPLDLSLYETARTAYMEQTGVAPEQVLDNVIHH